MPKVADAARLILPNHHRARIDSGTLKHPGDQHALQQTLTLEFRNGVGEFKATLEAEFWNQFFNQRVKLRPGLRFELGASVRVRFGSNQFASSLECRIERDTGQVWVRVLFEPFAPPALKIGRVGCGCDPFGIVDKLRELARAERVRLRRARGVRQYRRDDGNGDACNKSDSRFHGHSLRPNNAPPRWNTDEV